MKNFKTNLGGNSFFCFPKLSHLLLKRRASLIFYDGYLWKKNSIWLVLLLFTNLAYGQLCDNRCLDFEDSNNQITLALNPTLGNNDFTVEAWFQPKALPTNPDCSSNIRTLISLHSATTSLEVGVCSGQLALSWQAGGSNTVQGSTVNLNGWHHLAVVKDGADIKVYLDCVLDFTETVGVLATDTLRIGQGIPTADPTDNWLGRADEIRLWNGGRTLLQIDEFKNCVLPGNDPNLLAYWQLDQGIEMGNNTSPLITHATDLSGNGNDGLLKNFTLMTAISNFVCSGAKLVYPNYNNLELELKDPLQTGILTEICNNDPVHFCLFDGINIPPSSPNNTIIWQMNDNGGGWQHVTSAAFKDFCFVVPPKIINLDCSSTAGFVERAYRASIQVTDPVLSESCTYITEADTLLICCPITMGAIQIPVDTQMCEGDIRTINVTLNSHNFVTPVPGPNVDVVWDTNGVIIPSLMDMTTFSLTFTAGISDFCVNATITNCGGKKVVVSKCISVDPKPVCGEITDAMMPPNLIPDALDDNLYYICPENDAALWIDPLATAQFANCNPQWQYSFDLTTWSPLGFSNSKQNTNVLPTFYFPPNTDSIYYRIECQPFSNPSACMPCQSDTVKIKIKEAPLVATISGINPICLGNSSLLSVDNPETGIIYEWFCNGLSVGAGTTFSAIENACYWVEASNGCVLVESQQFCLEVCEIIPIISCPLTPNECAYEGVPVTLSGCDSETKNCTNPNLTYAWVVDGLPISSTNCMITFTPPVGGANVTLTVTDLTSGCSASTNTSVETCPN